MVWLVVDKKVKFLGAFMYTNANDNDAKLMIKGKSFCVLLILLFQKILSFKDARPHDAIMRTKAYKSVIISSFSFN